MIDAETVKLAIAHRASGLTLAAISDRLKISTSALKQIFKKHDVKRGTHRSAIVQQAKNLLVQDVTLASRISESVAASIANDLALANRVRDNASVLLDEIYNDSNSSVQVKARALTALATAVSLSQAICFKALDIEKQRATVSDNELPSLVISGFSDDEMQDIRRRASMTDLQLTALEESESEGL